MLRVFLLGLLLLLIARAFWRVADGLLEGVTGERRRQVRPATKLVRDPVCGTFVAPGNSLSIGTGSTTNYFCSEKCRNEFRKRA